MDISKFYELRTRLYNAAAAGCMTVSEDFRLKRAVEDFKPLAEANKAFAKLYSLCGELLSSDKPEGVIADCIALADALAVTQGIFADNAETTPSEGIFAPTEKPASALAAVEALIHKGSAELWKLPKEYKDTLRDPRVIFAFLNELETGRSNENFNVFCEIMCEICGKELVPALKASVKTSGRQLQYIVKLSGSDENEFFRALAQDENTPEKVRLAAISVLSCSQENGALLAELYNTGKAKVKQAALLTMAEMDAPEAEPIFEKLLENYDKNKKTLGEAIIASSGKACAEFVRKHLAELPDDLKSPIDYAIASGIELLANKTELDDVYFALSTKKHANNFASSRCSEALLAGLAGIKSKAVQAQIDRLYAKAPKEFSRIKVFSDFITDPDKEPIVSEDQYDINDLFDSITYVPLMGKYFALTAPFYNTYLLPLRPLGERLPDWLIRKIYEIADNAEKLFKSIDAPKRKDMLKNAERLGYGKNGADALTMYYKEQRLSINKASSSINNALLPYASREDYPRVLEAAVYFAKKICAGFGGISAFSVIADNCTDIDNKKLIDMMNTSVVTAIKMQNTSGRNFPLNYMSKRFTSDELLAGWKDLRERVAALRGSLDDKDIDDELYLIDSWIKRF